MNQKEQKIWLLAITFISILITFMLYDISINAEMIGMLLVPFAIVGFTLKQKKTIGQKKEQNKIQHLSSMFLQYIITIFLVFLATGYSELNKEIIYEFIIFLSLITAILFSLSIFVYKMINKNK